MNEAKLKLPVGIEFFNDTVRRASTMWIKRDS